MTIMSPGKAEKLLALLALLSYFEATRTEPTVKPLSKTAKLIVDSFETSFEPAFVRDVRLVNEQKHWYQCEFIKDVPKLFLDIEIHDRDENREIYKLDKIDGCMLIMNPLFNKGFHDFYSNLLVNKTPALKCPLKGGKYLFRSDFYASQLPKIHPKGNFTLGVILKSRAKGGTMLTLKWLYSVVSTA